MQIPRNAEAAAEGITKILPWTFSERGDGGELHMWDM